MGIWFSGRNVLVRRFLTASVLLSLLACAVVGTSAADEQTMQSLGSALTKLSSAVDVTVAYEDIPEGTSDQELLIHSTQQDPALLARFEGYRLRVLNKNKYVVLLVCSETQDRALLEDAACTAQLDRHAWRERTRCEFTLTDSQLCKLP